MEQVESENWKYLFVLDDIMDLQDQKEKWQASIYQCQCSYGFKRAANGA